MCTECDYFNRNRLRIAKISGDKNGRPKGGPSNRVSQETNA